jgi:hypothetical protein
MQFFSGGDLTAEAGAVAFIITVSALAIWPTRPGAPRLATSLFYGFVALAVVAQFLVLFATGGGQLVSR